MSDAAPVNRPGLRWYLKKTARAGVMFGSYGSGIVALRAMRQPRVRVLTYHRIGTDRYDPFSVNPAEFERQVRLLAEQQRAISLDQLIDFVNGKVSLRPASCLVTIDDGMLSTLTEALPILARWNVPAIAFVSANLVGRDAGAYGERYLTWHELRELAESGVVEIGSHSFNHRSLGLMPADEAQQEIALSRTRLSQELQREVRSFAYPFGTRTDFNAATEHSLRDAGFTVGFHSLHGAVVPQSNLLSLPRVKIEGGENLLQFSLISKGGTDLWRVIDNNLWRLQRVRAEIG